MNENFFEKRNKYRNYLHFDDKKNATWLYNYVCQPANIETHSFFPFINYKIVERKYQRKNRNLKIFEFSPSSLPIRPYVCRSTNYFTKEGKKLLHYKAKTREINFASHIDSNIYAYYSHLLASPYEQFLSTHHLYNHVLAFRKVQKNVEDTKKSQCNIDFCKTVFDEIRQRQTCVVLCFDITKFFDNLDHQILKDVWNKLLGTPKLPNDHYQVFKSLTQFASVDKRSIYKTLNISLNNKRPKKNGKRLTRLCSIHEFRDKVRRNNLIEVNKKGYGIPQGSPISGMLSNVYMMSFDLALHDYMQTIGGEYFRYCDDILCICSNDYAIELKKFIENKVSELKLKINDKKTQTVIFVDGQVALPAEEISFNFPNKLQYLGLTFDGSKVALRESGISKYHYKMRKAIRMRVRHFKNLKENKKLTANKMYMRKLYKKYTYIGKRNYISYVFRVAQIHDSKNVKRQISGHFNDFNNYLDRKLA